MRAVQIAKPGGEFEEMYDPKTFVAAVTALFEQKTIEFTD